MRFSLPLFSLFLNPTNQISEESNEVLIYFDFYFEGLRSETSFDFFFLFLNPITGV